jgi:hypothetical protein
VEKIIPPIPAALYDPNNPDVSSHLMIEKGSVADSPDLKEAKLYYQADLIIENTQGKDKNGNPVNLAPCGAVKTKTFYDARDKQTMTVTEVDVGKLTACGLAPPNGILYVSKDGANGGVRLMNGKKLPSQGLTVVSENPVYIQGDYNTVDKVPAAVLGDAITVLSNNWGPNEYDDEGDEVPSERPAAATTVNAALAMGPHAEAAPGAVSPATGGETNCTSMSTSAKLLRNRSTPPSAVTPSVSPWKAPPRDTKRRRAACQR